MALAISGGRLDEPHDYSVTVTTEIGADIQFRCRENLTLQERILLLTQMANRFLQEKQP